MYVAGISKSPQKPASSDHRNIRMLPNDIFVQKVQQLLLKKSSKIVFKIKDFSEQEHMQAHGLESSS